MHAFEIRVPDNIEFPPILDLWSRNESKGPNSTKILEFYRNLERGRLTSTFCDKCNAFVYPPRIFCPSCRSTDLRWVDIDKRGTLYSFTEIRVGAPYVYNSYLPLVVGVARFGDCSSRCVQLSGVIVNASYKELSPGDEVVWDVMKVTGPRNLSRTWYCFRKVT